MRKLEDQHNHKLNNFTLTPKKKKRKKKKKETKISNNYLMGRESSKEDKEPSPRLKLLWTSLDETSSFSSSSSSSLSSGAPIEDELSHDSTSSSSSSSRALTGSQISNPDPTSFRIAESTSPIAADETTTPYFVAVGDGDTSMLNVGLPSRTSIINHTQNKQTVCSKLLFWNFLQIYPPLLTLVLFVFFSFWVSRL